MCIIDQSIKRNVTMGPITWRKAQYHKVVYLHIGLSSEVKSLI